MDISHEQYLEAKKIVEQYELYELEYGTREADNDVNFEDEEEIEDECGYCGAIDCLCSEWELCSCGAYIHSQKLGRIIRVSDCIC